LVEGGEVCGAGGVEGVAVDVGGDGDGAVAEGVGDVFDPYTGFGEEGGGGVAEEVGVDVPDAGGGGDALALSVRLE